MNMENVFFHIAFLRFQQLHKARWAYVVFNEIVYSFEYIWGGGGSEQIPKNHQFYMKRVALNKQLYFSQKSI